MLSILRFLYVLFILLLLCHLLLQNSDIISSFLGLSPLLWYIAMTNRDICGGGFDSGGMSHIKADLEGRIYEATGSVLSFFLSFFHSFSFSNFVGFHNDMQGGRMPLPCHGAFARYKERP